MGYTKLFSRILGSTIWLEDDPTRILWITMLAMADQDGYIFASIPGLASQAHIPLEICEKALKKFESPDEYSSTPAEDGRRVRRIEGGWLLINHGKYHDLMSRDDRLQKQRERQKRYRERLQNKGCDAGDVTVTHVTTPDQTRSDAEQNKTSQSQEDTVFGVVSSDKNETVVDTHTLPLSKKRKAAKSFSPPTFEELKAYLEEKKHSIDPQKFLDYYEARGWKYKGNVAMKDWKAAVRTWVSNEKANDDDQKAAERRLREQRDNKLFLAAENAARMRGTLREDPH